MLHRVYQEMAEHFGTVILPARAARPKDKAKVEAGVQIAQRQILAALRDQSFFSVGALNQAIRPLLDRLNDQPFQKLEGSRNSWFEAEEKAKLLPLPATPFQLATWVLAKVNIDYHVVVDKHYYSVPYGLIHQAVEARLTDATVEIFHQGKLSVSAVIDGEFFGVNEGMGSEVAGGNEIGGRCPPDPLGFIAYRLAPAG